LVSTMSSMGQSAASTQAGIENVAYLGALIAVNLAVMNLLPLPALDGGKIFFLIINALCMLLFKKQIPEKYENYIHLVGFGLLMLLMVIVTFQDVWKLFQ
jgi:regulator of sigma E protease